jgi:hypothetical protein
MNERAKLPFGDFSAVTSGRIFPVQAEILVPKASGEPPIHRELTNASNQ